MKHIVKTKHNFIEEEHSDVKYAALSFLTIASQFVCGFYIYKFSKFVPLSTAFGLVTGQTYGALFSSLGAVSAMETIKKGK